MGSPVFVGIQRILVAFDASPHAEHALDVALSMAGDMKAKLFVISIIRPPEPSESAEFNVFLLGSFAQRDETFLIALLPVFKHCVELRALGGFGRSNYRDDEELGFHVASH